MCQHFPQFGFRQDFRLALPPELGRPAAARESGSPALVADALLGVAGVIDVVVIVVGAVARAWTAPRAACNVCNVLSAVSSGVQC